jgi:LemA protein
MKTLIIVLALLLGSVLYVMSARNNLVTLEENVNEKWAQVQNVYQRRADLVPNLVATVKGYATHEKETLTQVIEARSKATQISPQALNQAITDPQIFANYQKAQDGLSQALSKLMVVVERYPELKANENFLTLQSQLEGTENRITVERQRYNEAAKVFNTEIRLFPKNVVASLFNIQRKNFFEAQAGSDQAPKVQF